MIQLKLSPMPRTGPRKSRREGLVRAKKDGILFVCIGFRQADTDSSCLGVELEYAVVTSKKSVSKLAVVRNKCRRRTKAALLCLKSDTEFLSTFKPNFTHLELLIVHQRNSTECSFEDFQSTLRAGLLRLADNLNYHIRQ